MVPAAGSHWISPGPGARRTSGLTCQPAAASAGAIAEPRSPEAPDRAMARDIEGLGVIIPLYGDGEEKVPRAATRP